jgi:hypothetical protein
MWSSRKFLYLGNSDPEHDSLAGDLMCLEGFEPFYSKEQFDDPVLRHRQPFEVIIRELQE